MLRRLIGEDIDLQLALGPDLGMVSADPGQIEQVLMNLVVNARDAMPKGGTLTIETANVQLDEGYTGRHLAVKPGPYAQIAVSDNGGGMDEATQARLFEPFFTTKGVGAGNGAGALHGVRHREAERRESGRVQRAQPRHFGEGLPAAHRSAGGGGGRIAAQRGDAGSETVLLVEDDEMVRHLVRETLVRAGYKVMDTSDPLEARRLSESYRGPIHLLITDVVMPKVSGRELAEELAARRGSMKVLYMSGYTDNAIVNTGILQKKVAFLQKPFTPAALTEKVRDILDSGGRIAARGEVSLASSLPPVHIVSN